MKSIVVTCAVFAAAHAVPVAGWAEEDSRALLELAEKAEDEGYDPDRPILAELTLEYLHNNSDDPDEQEDDYTATLDVVYYFNENVSLAGSLLGASVRGEGTFPNDYDFYFEELYLNAEFDRFGFFGGKFNPVFGIGFDDVAGELYGAGYHDGYELTERLGAGVTYAFEDALGGEHTLGASAFQLDTSFLAKSFLRGERLASREDGGLSNTGGLNSYTVWLEGDDAFGIEDSRYNITYRSQEGGLPGEETETGFAAGASKLIELGNGNGLELYAELVSLDNSQDDGVSFDQDTLMANAAYYFGEDWVATLGGGVQDVSNSSDIDEIANGSNRFATASVGKTFYDSFYVELAYKRDRTNGTYTNSAGIFLSYSVEF
ncbi:hypothetical protein [Leisingera sp. JC11]|uniref:hypothetical protein n=1 Tax=Leisingera sp. JC11 TaxID=3042469 RepID=UPI003455953B